MKPKIEIEHKNPFRVPDNYFETLSERIICTVHNSEKVSTTDTVKKTKFSRLRPYITMAAILSGFAIITLSIIKLNSKHDDLFLTAENATGIMNDIINEEIDVYLIESEIITPADNQSAYSGEESEINDNIILENIEETDIYNL